MSNDTLASGAPAALGGPLPGPSADVSLAERVATMVSAHERARAERLHTIADRMSERAAAEARFAEAAPILRDHVVRPRVEALARPFAHAHLDDTETPVGVHTRLVLDHTDQFPVKATLTAGVLLDAGRSLVRFFTKTELVPLLVAAEPHAWRDLALDTLVTAARTSGSSADAGGALAEWNAATRWLDERLLAFLRTYLDTSADPHYQQMSTHVDPVCGMQIHAGTVVAHQAVRGHTYYFCSATCAARFASDPAYYIDRRCDR